MAAGRLTPQRFLCFLKRTLPSRLRRALRFYAPGASVIVLGVHRRPRKSLGLAKLRPGKKGGKEMPLIQLVMVLIVVGVVLWLINTFIPMQGTIKSILNAVVVIVVVLWLLNVFGLFHSFSNIRVG
jgi:hypothetical protein